MTRVALSTAALVAAVAVWGVSLPPRRMVLPATAGDVTVRGALHVHSSLSDGRGTIEEIARAAARAGLAFVIVTDHGDGTRPPRAPAYYDGVLCIDAVEISTRGGHYVALGLPASPYPLGGEAADVVEDVRRLGGFGVAAHPDSPKIELQWTAWDAPIDGIELLNPDTSWRVHAFTGGPRSWLLLFGSLLSYPVRPAETIGRLFTDTSAVRRQWAALTERRNVVGLAGADAHARVAIRDAEPGDNRFTIPIPSYESSFEALSIHVQPLQPFSGDAAADAASLLSGIRAGRLFVAIDGWASPGSLEFTASSGETTVAAGGALSSGAPVTLHVSSNAPPGFVTRVMRGERAIDSRAEARFDLAVGGEPGVYTIDVVRMDGAGEPAWLSSNPIYVRPPTSTVAPTGPVAPIRTPAATRSLFDGRTSAGWSTESDATSLAVVEAARMTAGPRVRLRFGLSGGMDVGQYVAAAVEVPAGAASQSEGVAFSVYGERPMRLSVQIRAEPPGQLPLRWQQSIYLDDQEREQFVRFDQMRPVPPATGALPRADLRAVMFVVDTTNTAPGTSGRVWLGAVRLVGASR